MNEWISVEDRLPDEGKEVLLFIVVSRMYGGSFSEDEVTITGGIEDGDWYVGSREMIWDYDYNIGLTGDDVTHWMPLPEPPQ